MNDRHEIELILESLSNPKTRVYVTQDNIAMHSSRMVVETPIPPEDSFDSSSSVSSVSPLPKGKLSFPRNRRENDPVLLYHHINGLVLNINSIIKDDYFPGSRNTLLVPQLDGAPNFRVSRFIDRVFGVGIPMINGVANTVEYIQKTYGSNNIVGEGSECEIDMGEFERRTDYLYQREAVFPSKRFGYD